MVNRKRFEVEIPEGQHLGLSRDTDGAYRAHLFDDETNGLVGHAELFEPDDGEAGSPTSQYAYGSDARATERDEQLDELADLLGNLIAIAIIKAVEAAAPHFKRWWHNKALPTFTAARARIRSTWNRIPLPHNSDGRSASGELAALNVPADARPYSEMDAVLEGLRVKMSSTEARQRFAAALVAAYFAEEQMRLLRNAEIEDDAAASELASTLRKLTPEQVGATVNLMLKKDPSLLDRETLTEFGRVLDEVRTDREYLPMRGSGVRQLLSLTDGQSGADVADHPASNRNQAV